MFNRRKQSKKSVETNPSTLLDVIDILQLMEPDGKSVSGRIIEGLFSPLHTVSHIPREYTPGDPGEARDLKTNPFWKWVLFKDDLGLPFRHVENILLLLINIYFTSTVQVPKIQNKAIMKGRKKQTETTKKKPDKWKFIMLLLFLIDTPCASPVGDAFPETSPTPSDDPAISHILHLPNTKL